MKVGCALVGMALVAAIGCKDKPAPASTGAVSTGTSVTEVANPAPTPPPKGLLREVRARLKATTIVADPRKGETMDPPPPPRACSIW